LEAFRELHEPWRESISSSINFLKEEWQRRHQVAVTIITNLLIDQVTYEQELAIEPNENPQKYKNKIETEFHEHLRKHEQKARIAIEHLYQHLRIETEEDELDRPIFEEDLFAQSTWSLLGLTPKQLIAFGTIAGATVGGIVDASVGGASFFAGTLLGGALGGASVLYFSTNRFASIENIIGVMQGKQLIQIGPHKNPNFPWIVLDRALLHFKNIRELAHSRRDKIKLSTKNENQRVVAALDSSTRKALNQVFSAIRKKRITESVDQKNKLENLLHKIIEDL
jgi:hypothetical protein